MSQLTAGTVTYEALPNAALANSSLTVGSTSLALGSTTTSISGLTSLNLGTAGTTAGVLGVANGGGSGASISVQNPSATTAYNFNLPTTAGTSGYALTSGGGGGSPMAWTAIAPATGSASVTTLGTVTSGTWNASTIGVPYGGTGASTLATHGVLIGEGTSAVTSLTAAAGGTILQGNGTSADPTFTAAPVIGVNGTTTGTIGLANAAGGGATTTIQPSTSATTPWTMTLPSGPGTNTYLLQTNGAGVTSWVAPTSAVSAFGSQSANLVLAAPNGSAGNPTFRSLVATDIPALSATSITSGTLAVAQGGTGGATGSITGTGALTMAAGGSNQNVTIAPSGTGYTVLGGNVGIGTNNPTSLLTVNGTIQSSSGGIIFPDTTTQTTASTTNTNNAAVMSPSPFVLTSSYSNIGLSVTLPSAGTYLIMANVRATITDTTQTGSYISVELYNTTAGSVVSNSNTIVASADVINMPSRASTAPIDSIVTVAVPTTIAVYGEVVCSGNCPTADILSNSVGYSRLTYIKLSN